MKIEKLSKGRFKNIVIIVLIISIIGVVTINKSKAKYRVTQSIQVVSGEVNYTNPDFSMLGVKLQSDKGSGDYVSASNNKVPTSGYKLKPLGDGATDSYCTINGTKNNTGITITYENGTVTFKGITDQGTRCYLFFDLLIGPTGTELLEKYKGTMGSGTPNFSKTACADGCGEKTNGLYKTTDSDGKDTYYFRGTVNNNWVKLGNFYWRIIRFNSNGSIRLIYSGTGTAAETEDGTQIGTSAFNSTNSDQRYVKFVYGSTSSTIKQKLDSWYTSNLTNFASKLDGAAGFCNDGDESTSSFYKEFPPFYRNDEKSPSLLCSKANLFTTSGNSNGNEKLTNPIGLITSDEVILAGSVTNEVNSSFYLYTSSYYWTMSPAYFETRSFVSAGVFYVGPSGYPGCSLVTSQYGIRPVINLKANTAFKEGGDGSKNNPYEVVI